MLQITDKDLKLIMSEKVSKIYKTVQSLNDVLFDELNVILDSTLQQDVILFFIPKSQRRIKIENTRINIQYNGGDTKYKIILFNNNSRELTISNCSINFSSKNQVSFTAIYNYGGLDTHLETQADNLLVEGCRIFCTANAQNIKFSSSICGIENILANSIAISNNFIFSQASGNGENQKVFGIINSGRFARIENNNIKANGTHNVGKLLEQAHCFGMYNAGLYMIFTGNNCVGEWGGKCVGLYNDSSYANISGNKILATHTICGRTVKLLGDKNILSNNVLTNTSRNPHIIEIFSDENLVCNNYLQGLLGFADYKSGCGIYIEGKEKRIKNCIISNNIIKTVKDYGILLINTESNTVESNKFLSFTEATQFVSIFHSERDYIRNDEYKSNEKKGDLHEVKPQNFEYSIKSIDVNS